MFSFVCDATKLALCVTSVCAHDGVFGYLRLRRQPIVSNDCKRAVQWLLKLWWKPFAFSFMTERYWACLLDLTWGVGAQGAPVPGSPLQQEIIQVLLENEFEGLQELRFAPTPRSWLGTRALADDAFIFLESWQNDVIEMASKR